MFILLKLFAKIKVMITLHFSLLMSFVFFRRLPGFQRMMYTGSVVRLCRRRVHWLLSPLLPRVASSWALLWLSLPTDYAAIREGLKNRFSVSPVVFVSECRLYLVWLDFSVCLFVLLRISTSWVWHGVALSWRWRQLCIKTRLILA